MKTLLLWILTSLMTYGLMNAAERVPTPKIVIAHRGASGYLPEHTLEGVAMSHAWGVDFIEPDVVLTKDLVPIVLHDLTLEATTDVESKFPARFRPDGKWYAIDFTLKEIKTLNVHERTQGGQGPLLYPRRFPLHLGNFQVPTLREFLELIQGLNHTTGRKTGIYLEIKDPEFHQLQMPRINPPDGPVVSAVAEASGTSKVLAVVGLILKEIYAAELPSTQTPLIIQSFSQMALQQLSSHWKAPFPLVQLLDNSPRALQALTPDGIKTISRYAKGIGLPYTLLLPASSQRHSLSRPLPKSPLVKLAHEQGLFVHPYTVRMENIPDMVKNPEDFFQLLFFELGADGLFTDHGDRVKEFLEKRPNPASQTL